VFSLLFQRPFSQFSRFEIPAFAVSLAIAELFYKFHSFSLECLAFLATWCALGGLLCWALGQWRPSPAPDRSVPQ
jgi:hypothetical protein